MEVEEPQTQADSGALWTLRVCRTDSHNTLVPLRVFPDATIWELKVLMSHVSGVHPAQIVLLSKGRELRGGQIHSMAQQGVGNLATLTMSVNPCRATRPPLVPCVATSEATLAAAMAVRESRAAHPRVMKLSPRSYRREVSLLPRRRWMSNDLKAAIIAATTAVEGVTPLLLDPVSSRLDVYGESCCAVDSGSGLNVLQLGIVHAKSASLVKWLLMRDDCVASSDSHNAHPIILAAENVATHTLLPLIARKTTPPSALMSRDVVEAVERATTDYANRMQAMQRLFTSGGSDAGQLTPDVAELQECAQKLRMDYDGYVAHVQR